MEDIYSVTTEEFSNGTNYKVVNVLSNTQKRICTTWKNGMMAQVIAESLNLRSDLIKYGLLDAVENKIKQMKEQSEQQNKGGT